MISYRQIVNIVSVDEEIDMDGPGDCFEKEMKKLESKGFYLENWAITDVDIEWEAYLNYLVDWAINHTDPGYEGMSPASYNEWRDCEYETGK